MSSEERTFSRRDSLSKSVKEERQRSLSPYLEEEEELDEFGRVKRRREKFKSERTQDIEEEDRSDNEHSRSRYRRHRRRSSSTSRSPPRKSYRRRYSDSDSDYEHRRRRSSSRHHSSSRHRSPSRHRHHSRRDQRHHYYKNGANVYSEAAQYIDTEFYSTKIYIGDLENVTESEVESAFSRFGVIEGVRLVEGKDYGFVTYERKEDALAAIQSMHGVLLGSKHIKVNRAKIPERNKVGFGNIPWQDEDGLMAKEANFEYSRKDPSIEDSTYPLDPSITRRILTSYDDL